MLGFGTTYEESGGQCIKLKCKTRQVLLEFSWVEILIFFFFFVTCSATDLGSKLTSPALTQPPKIQVPKQIGNVILWFPIIKCTTWPFLNPRCSKKAPNLNKNISCVLNPLSQLFFCLITYLPFGVFWGINSRELFSSQYIIEHNPILVLINVFLHGSSSVKCIWSIIINFHQLHFCIVVRNEIWNITCWFLGILSLEQVQSRLAWTALRLGFYPWFDFWHSCRIWCLKVNCPWWKHTKSNTLLELAGF